MKHDDNREKWYKLMQEYERSGKSVGDWCAESGYSYHMFKYWRYRVRIQETYECASDVLPKGWAIATLPDMHRAGISISIGSARISVERGFDRLLLREIVEALS